MRFSAGMTGFDDTRLQAISKATVAHLEAFAYYLFTPTLTLPLKGEGILG